MLLLHLHGIKETPSTLLEKVVWAFIDRLRNMTPIKRVEHTISSFFPES